MHLKISSAKMATILSRGDELIVCSQHPAASVMDIVYHVGDRQVKKTSRSSERNPNYHAIEVHKYFDNIFRLTILV